jgi:flagella basal body P-ring formation protein FlgA
MRARIAAVAFLLLGAGVSAAPRTTIELLPQALVAGDTVTLGDLAHLRSTDLDLMRKLVRLPVGRAPQAGQAAVVQQPALAAWIQRQPGLSQEQLQWTGALETRVRGTQRRLAGEEIGNAAVDALRPWLASRGVAGHVQLAATPRDLDIPGGEVRLQVRPMEQVQLRSRSVAWVDVWAGGAFVRTVPVTLEFANAALLAAETHTRDLPLLEHVGDMRQTARDGDVPPAVARGEWASLRSVSGAIALESRVEVLQDGQPGQRVRVRQQGATGIVFARVIGRGQLELAP